jgi:serine/threonine protein kinase
MAVIRGPSFSYSDVKPLTEGSYGQIFSAIQTPGGQNVILKKMSKTLHHRAAAEIACGMRLRGVRSCSQMRCYFETNNSLWLVFDRVDGKDLYATMSESNFEAWPERRVKRVATQLLTAVSKCHEHNISHKVSSFLIFYKLSGQKVLGNFPENSRKFRMREFPDVSKKIR